MKRDGPGNKSQRDHLRRKLLDHGYTPEQIAAEMTLRWGFRPRAAWRHAYGWTQEEVAARFNEMVDSGQSTMTGKRISDYESWPMGGVKPTLTALGVLAQVYSTQSWRLVDFTDREAMTPSERVVLDTPEENPQAENDQEQGGHPSSSSVLATNERLPTSQTSRHAEGFEGRKRLHPIGYTRVADSTLIVVKAILLGWQLDQVLASSGDRVVYTSLQWSDEIVRSVAEGLIHIAIYNERRTRRMQKERPDVRDRVSVIGRFGHSMGGRNFYILAARSGRWGTTTADEFLENPAGAQIAVPTDSDMFSNLLAVLGTDEDGLHSRGVEILDVPHHLGLEIFHLNHDVLAVGGQNLRIHARLSGDFVEIVNCEMLNFDLQRQLWEAASNIAIASTEWLDDAAMNTQDLYRELLRNFLWYWSDPGRYQERVEELVMSAAFPVGSSRDMKNLLVNHVLFETYRFGEPS